MTSKKEVSKKEIGFEVGLRDITSLNFKKQAHSTNCTIRIYFSTKLQLCNKGTKKKSSVIEKKSPCVAISLEYVYLVL